MTNASIPFHVYEQFKLIVGEPYLITDESLLKDYGSDETEKLHYAPQVVVKPRSAEEISKLLELKWWNWDIDKITQNIQNLTSTEIDNLVL